VCGICGICGEFDKSTLKNMANVIRHRGPDDSGSYIDRGIGIYNRRLSIIDLKSGHQPIHNEDDSVWIVFNGEIYNFQELRSTLEKNGHRFYTNSDTETIVHAYEEWGVGCLPRLNGMFAFAIWDSTKSKLLLARDRTGIKPLYYLPLGGNLLFGSEIKSILQDDRVKIEPDMDAIFQFLNLRYFPGEKTPFLYIRKLLPGHYLEFQNGAISIVQYWSLKPYSTYYTEDYYVKQLELTMQRTVKRHMISDVPIGFYLSGGVDSSSVVYFAKQVATEPLKTFCMGFNEDSDEFKDAQLVADILGTDHYNLIINTSLLKDFVRMIWYADIPKRNLYPYYVAELARKHVKVVLNGLGADELFGGYTWKYDYIRRIETPSEQKAPLKLETMLKEPLADLTKEEFFDYLKELYRKGEKSTIYTLIQTADKLFPQEYSTIFDALPFDAKSLKTNYEGFFKSNATFVEQVMLADFNVKMPDDFLLVDDATSMAHSLESRVPFLDNELVEFAFSIPHHIDRKSTRLNSSH
jgi:asparagine synthase (glutamine-hydrolysing)